MATITAKLLVAYPYREDTLPASTDPKHASSSLDPPRSNFLELRNDESRRIHSPRTAINSTRVKPPSSVLPSSSIRRENQKYTFLPLFSHAHFAAGTVPVYRLFFGHARR
jgi:hypothetical protein